MNMADLQFQCPGETSDSQTDMGQHMSRSFNFVGQLVPRTKIDPVAQRISGLSEKYGLNTPDQWFIIICLNIAQNVPWLGGLPNIVRQGSRGNPERLLSGNLTVCYGQSRFQWVNHVQVGRFPWQIVKLPEVRKECWTNHAYQRQGHLRSHAWLAWKVQKLTWFWYLKIYFAMSQNESFPADHFYPFLLFTYHLSCVFICHIFIRVNPGLHTTCLVKITCNSRSRMPSKDVLHILNKHKDETETLNHSYDPATAALPAWCHKRRQWPEPTRVVEFMGDQLRYRKIRAFAMAFPQQWLRWSKLLSKKI